MLKLAIVFLVLGLGASLFGFFGLGDASPAPAQLLAFLSLVLFGIFFILGSPAIRHLI